MDVYIDSETGKAYTDPEKSEEVTPESGKIYVDAETGDSYRFGGQKLDKLPDTSDMKEISPEDVETMWRNPNASTDVPEPSEGDESEVAE